VRVIFCKFKSRIIVVSLLSFQTKKPFRLAGFVIKINLSGVSSFSRRSATIPPNKIINYAHPTAHGLPSARRELKYSFRVDRISTTLVKAYTFSVLKFNYQFLFSTTLLWRK